MAGAQMAIVNGIGYDPWASKLLAANPSSGRTVLTVGDLLGLEGRGQPPPVVLAGLGPEGGRADHRRLQAGRPGHAAYFDAQQHRFETRRPGPVPRPDLPDPRALRGHAGRRLGEHLRAARAGARPEAAHPDAGSSTRSPRAPNPTPADKATTDSQIADHQIKVWVYNSQNATPDVQRLNDAAKAAGIPIATVTETHDPRRRQLPGVAVARAGRARGGARQGKRRGMRRRPQQRRPAGRPAGGRGGDPARRGRRRGAAGGPSGRAST